MDKKVIFAFKIISWIIMALAIVLQIMILTQGSDNVTAESPVLNNFTNLSFIALGLAAAGAILFPIFQIISNPKSAIKILLSLAALIIVGFIAYSFAGNAFDELKLIKLETTVEVSTMVGAALYFTYIIGGLAVLSILYASISNALK